MSHLQATVIVLLAFEYFNYLSTICGMYGLEDKDISEKVAIICRVIVTAILYFSFTFSVATILTLILFQLKGIILDRLVAYVPIEEEGL